MPLPVPRIGIFLLFFFCFVPSFTVSTVVTFDLLEESPAGTVLGTLSHESQVVSLFPRAAIASLRFRFLSSSAAEHQRMFRLTEEVGQLVSAESLDRERLCSSERDDGECVLQLEVATQPKDLFKVIRVNVRLIDINDHVPRFIRDSVQLVISELTVPETAFSLLEAEDPDSGTFGIQGYGILANDSRTNGTFGLKTDRALDGTTELRLILARNLDREEADEYRMQVVAWDGGSPAKTGTLLVEIKVQDVNDNRPEFVEPVYDVSIEENIPNGTVIGVVRAVDRDVGVNGVVTFALARNTQLQFGSMFAVGAESGEIRITGLVDYERRNKYTLGIVASDHGSNPHSSHAIVTVHVTDVNDNAPRISVNSLTRSSKPEVKENAEVGAFVAHVSVADPDSGAGGAWNCSLTGNPGFRLERIPEVRQNEFKLVTATAFDREEADLHHVTLSCADRGLPPLTSSTEIEIRINDENDEAPEFLLPEYSASVRENNNVGDFIGEVKAVDRDLPPSGKISYKISSDETSGSLPVTIDAKLGRIYANVVFDREGKNRYNLLVIASDGGLPVRSSTVHFRLDIIDVNDEPPTFASHIFTFGTYENQLPGTEIGTVTATDSDAYPFNRVVYEIDDFSYTFRIDSSKGRITLQKSLDRELVPVYLFNVTGRNPGSSLYGETQVKVIVADRNDNPPTIRFPSTTNNSVQISSRARIGEIIANVDASDSDVGSNAALRYVIDGSDVTEGLFSVNLLSGAIAVRRDLSRVADRTLTLRLLVHDEGVPQKSASATLLVTVNSTLMAAAALPASVLPLSTFTIIVIASGVSLSLVVGLIILLTLLRHRRAPEVAIGQPEVDKMIPLADPRGTVTTVRNQKYPETKSNLWQKEEKNSKPLAFDKMVDRKNKKNASENRKNVNSNRKRKNYPEVANAVNKQIAWLTTYEDNLIQAYNERTDKMADPCCAASPSNGKLLPPPPPPSSSMQLSPPLPPPPPPPPPPPHPFVSSMGGYGESGGRRFFDGQKNSPSPSADVADDHRERKKTKVMLASCGCCGKHQHHPPDNTLQMSDVAGSVRSSDSASVTDSGRGQSEDGDQHVIQPPARQGQGRRVHFSEDLNLTPRAIYPRGYPAAVRWPTHPIYPSSVGRTTLLSTSAGCCCNQPDHRLLSNREPTQKVTDPVVVSDMQRFGTRPTDFRSLTGNSSVARPGLRFSEGRALKHEEWRDEGGKKEEEEDVYLSDDATTTSGSYVLELRDHHQGGEARV